MNLSICIVSDISPEEGVVAVCHIEVGRPQVQVGMTLQRHLCHIVGYQQIYLPILVLQSICGIYICFINYAQTSIKKC